MNKSNFNIQGSICKGLEKGFIFIQGIIISLYASIIFFYLMGKGAEILSKHIFLDQNKIYTQKNRTSTQKSPK